MAESRLQHTLDEVKDEGTFLLFLKALAGDRADEVRKETQRPGSPYGPGANGWENWTIEAFLETAAAWGESSKRSPQSYENPDNLWKRCAHIIYMGKMYE